MAGHECESGHDPERKSTGERDGTRADGWKRKTTHDERVRSSWLARVITALTSQNEISLSFPSLINEEQEWIFIYDCAII